MFIINCYGQGVSEIERVWERQSRGRHNYFKRCCTVSVMVVEEKIFILLQRMKGKRNEKW